MKKELTYSILKDLINQENNRNNPIKNLSSDIKLYICADNKERANYLAELSKEKAFIDSNCFQKKSSLIDTAVNSIFSIMFSPDISHEDYKQLCDRISLCKQIDELYKSNVCLNSLNKTEKNILEKSLSDAILIAKNPLIKSNINNKEKTLKLLEKNTNNPVNARLLNIMNNCNYIIKY